MKHSILLAVFINGLVSCAQIPGKEVNIPVGQKTIESKNEAAAYFAEGCFWHAEIVFQSLAGVRDVVSGYAGGTSTHPSYEQVCTGETGHAETVQVFYDPEKISYSTLVEAFFASHNPAELNRQGPDLGTQYRSIAFYQNEKEKHTIESEIVRISNSKKYREKIVTQVVSFAKFYAAEDYHQEYIKNHPGNPYVAQVSIPDFLKFKQEFKGPFK